MRREEKREIKTRMMAGETVKEIKQDAKFQGRETEVEEVSKRYIRLSLICKGMPYQEIARRELAEQGITNPDNAQVQAVSKSVSMLAYNEKVSSILKPKQEEVRQRLAKGQSVQEIVADRKLNVCQEAVEDWKSAQKERKQTKQGKSQQEKKITSKEIAQAVVDQMLSGKTPEEIKAMAQFQEYSLESIQSICQERAWIKDAIRLVSYRKLAESTGRGISALRVACSQNVVQGVKITQIRKQKTEALQKRLGEMQEGETVETVAQSLEVDVDAAKEIAKQVQAKKAPKNEKKKDLKPATSEEKDAVLTQMLAGKSPEKLQAMQEEMAKRPTQPKAQAQKQPEQPPKQPEPPVQMADSREERKRASQSNSAYLRMRIMQGKYQSKRKDGTKPEEKPQVEMQSEKERREIERILTSIEARMVEAEKDIAKTERKPIMQAMYQEAKALQLFNLDSEQATRFRKAMYGKAMELYMQACGPEPHERMVRIQKASDRKMIAAIESEVEQTTDAEKLQGFLMQVMNIKGQNTFLKERLTSIINRKLAKAREERAIYRLYHEIPPEVEEIVESLASGKIDVEETREKIANLASQKVAENPSKSRFALTQEQQERQIQIQIRNTLAKQAERFPVARPDCTFRLLREIGMQEELLNLRAIVDNQVGRRQFVEAKAFCNIYGKTEENDVARQGIYSIRNHIRNAEIGDLVRRGIEGQISLEGASQFWQALENGIKMGNVRLSQVIVSKTADGTKDITLADIWPDNQKGRNK